MSLLHPLTPPEQEYQGGHNTNDEKALNHSIVLEIAFSSTDRVVNNVFKAYLFIEIPVIFDEIRDPLAQ
jgi:hypothetical protein